MDPHELRSHETRSGAIFNAVTDGPLAHPPVSSHPTVAHTSIVCAAGEDLITTPPPSDGDNTSQVLCDTALAVSVLDPGGHPVLEYPHPTVYSTTPPTKDGDNTSHVLCDTALPLADSALDPAVAGYAHDLYAQGWIYFQNALSAYYLRDGIKLELTKEGPVWVLPPETHTRAHRGRDATGIDPADPGAVKGQPKEKTEEIPVIIDPEDPGEGL